MNRIMISFFYDVTLSLMLEPFQFMTAFVQTRLGSQHSTYCIVHGVMKVSCTMTLKSPLTAVTV